MRVTLISLPHSYYRRSYSRDLGERRVGRLDTSGVSDDVERVSARGVIRGVHVRVRLQGRRCLNTPAVARAFAYDGRRRDDGSARQRSNASTFGNAGKTALCGCVLADTGALYALPQPNTRSQRAHRGVSTLAFM